VNGRGVSELLKAIFGLAGLTVGALLISACGTKIHVRDSRMVVHLDGHVTGDYVRETSATGLSFLVPTGALEAQGSTTFDIASPPPSNPSVSVVGPKFTYTSEAQMRRWEKTWHIGPEITGTTPEAAHTELLVTGDPGRRIYLSFEESCGFFHLPWFGPKAVSARKGASGQRILRTPAVLMVPMLTSKPENTCYVSGDVVSRGPNDLHISLIDY
jgi:hypothetical protein